MFEIITDSFKAAVNKLRFVDDEKALKNALETLKKALLKADVHHKVVKDLLTQVESDTKKGTIGQKQFLSALRANLEQILGASGSVFTYASKPPTSVLMCGLQGSGKTTSVVKLANYLKLRKKKVLVAACDLQRLAAVEQLKQLCAANEIDIFFMDENKETFAKNANQNATQGVENLAQNAIFAKNSQNSPQNSENSQNSTQIPPQITPAQVAENALKKAQSELYDVLIIDTAGRLAIDEALMSELATLKGILNPHEIFYVADAMSGQDGVRTAGAFNERLGITGVILSKFDADTKGGVALGITRQIGVPLRFIGTGEKIADIEPFVSERIVSRIMGEGDLASLAEKTAAVFDEKTAKIVKQKLKKGEFNFDDFLQQMEAMKKLGSMKSLLGMIPGMSNLANQVKDLDLENSREMVHIRAMISSMTPKERQNPSLLNNSRKERIARGAGLSQMQVNRFFKQFENVARMAKRFSGKGGARGLENMLTNLGNARGARF